jgi:hypothetical protein
MGPKSRRRYDARLQTTGDAAPIGEPVDSALPTLDLQSLSTPPLNPSDQLGLLC